MIKFSCGCGKHLKVADESAGRKIKCPSCGKVAVAPVTVVAGAISQETAAQPSPDMPVHTGDRPTDPATNALEGTVAPAGSALGQTTQAQGHAIEAAGESWSLGGYRILRQLGEGGMGTVYEGEDIKLERRVALKVMKPEVAANQQNRERFLREACTAASVESDFICPIYEVGEENGVPFIAMPLLKGKPLNAHWKKATRLSINEVMRIGKEVAEGLSTAHEAGLIHRDIKPANIWLETQRSGPARAIILDFGLAHMQTDDVHITQSGVVVGTPAYMSPEQARGEANVDARTDLFSLGCVLYALCTGELPFKGETTMGILTALATHNPTPPGKTSSTPKPLSDLIMRLLAKKPSDRPQTAREVIEKLVEIAKDLANAATEAPTALFDPTPNSGSTIIQSPKGADKTATRTLALSPISDADTPLGNVSYSLVALIAAGLLVCVISLVGGGLYYFLADKGAIADRNGPDPIATPVVEGQPSLAIAPFDADQAKKYQEAWAKHLGVPVEYTNALGMKFRLIPPGTFRMGSSQEEIDRLIKLTEGSWEKNWLPDEGPEHEVQITHPFYLGATEVTVGQFRRFVKENNYQVGDNRWKNPGFEQAEDHPVVFVSWDNAVDFCSWLSQTKEKSYRLPTESEWEYCCRGGKVGARYGFGSNEEDLGLYAWHLTNSEQTTHPVGGLKANDWGLFDLHGNAWEMCRDHFDAGYYKISPAKNPSGPDIGDSCVFRGGCWGNPALNCHSAFRGRHGHDSRSHDIGFRAALSVDAVEQALTASTTTPPAAIAPFDAVQAQKHQKAWANHLGVPVEYTNSLGMKFRLIPPGTFTMGSSKVEIDRCVKLNDVIYEGAHAAWHRDRIISEGPAHEVEITQPFYLGATHVTVGQYRQFADKQKYRVEDRRWQNPDWEQTDEHPVVFVSWNDGIEFCRWLSTKKGLEYRLPTEAEWEYSCRAGTTTRYWFGDNEADVVRHDWTKANSKSKTQPVKQFGANPFGLYDMHGNAAQWCEDQHDPNYYQRSPRKDPRGDGDGRLVRGGTWDHHALYARSAFRNSESLDPNQQRGGVNSFRVALSVDAVKQAMKTAFAAKWGVVVDPLGDCQITEANGRLSIKVPGGNTHDLNPLPQCNLNAPRVLKEVEGDFIARVIVRPLAVRAKAQMEPGYVGAGLVLWQDEGQVLLRHSRQIGNQPGIGSEWWAGINLLGTDYLRGIKDGPVHLRLRRAGAIVHLAWSLDGKNWTEDGAATNLKLAPRVRVGISAVNGSVEAYTAEFEGFTVEP